jgi:hypothetical protein
MADNPHVAYLVRFIGTLILGVPIGAFVFPVTSGCFNKWISKSPAARLPEPSFVDAAWILFFSLCARGLIVYVVSTFVLHATMPQYSYEITRYETTVLLIAYPLSFVVSSIIISKMLPTSLLRGLLLSLAVQIVSVLGSSILNLKSL